MVVVATTVVEEAATNLIYTAPVWTHRIGAVSMYLTSLIQS